MLEMILQLAPTVHTSRLFPGISSPEQAALVMLAGAELGFSFTGSFQMLEMIQGRITLKPQAALALIHQTGNFDVDILDTPDCCTVTMTRHDTGFSYTAAFSLGDAQRAGLVKPDSNYAKWPANMLRWRAVGNCARVVAPDVLAGLYLSAELQAEVEE